MDLFMFDLYLKLAKIFCEWEWLQACEFCVEKAENIIKKKKEQYGRTY
ncbi:MAG: hypothetical protein HUJ58_08970 [Erysipelotrichaceae bacterium]|nr:hypothetical protein [Erysipelotrichaceae bacterium]